MHAQASLFKTSLTDDVPPKNTTQHRLTVVLALQMVDLLKKNPAVAIPVVLTRLVQKDSEWCAVNLTFSLRLVNLTIIASRGKFATLLRRFLC